MFMTIGSKFYNRDHEHLEDASIGYLLTNVENIKGGAWVLGTAQLGEPSGGTPWAKIKAYQQLDQWFGHIPDFIITLDSVFLNTADPAQICALIEHELYHCSIKKDDIGMPKLDRWGGATWEMRPHDVEEFTGVVGRYGAWKQALHEMKAAFDAEPLFGTVDLGGICGACHGK